MKLSQLVKEWKTIFLILAKFAFNATDYYWTGKPSFEIVYREMCKLEIIILNNVKKYSTALGGPSDDETLTEEICAQNK